MRLDDLMRQVLASSPKDWSSIPPPARQYLGTYTRGGEEDPVLYLREHSEQFVLRSDVQIGLTCGLDGFHGDRVLTFEWAANMPDPEIRGEFVDLTFIGQVVHREQLLVVDGGRTVLPTPGVETVDLGGDFREVYAETITPSQFKLAKLTDGLLGGSDFEVSFRRSSLVVMPEDER